VAANGKQDSDDDRADSGNAQDRPPRAGFPPPAPGSRLRLPLRTVDDVRAEIARVYREGKAGRRDVTDVSKLANVLAILGRLIEGSETLARLEQIEERLKRKG
jgi:hypothetical protein